MDGSVQEHLDTVKAMRSGMVTAAKPPAVFKGRVCDRYVVARVKDKDGNEDYKLWLYPAGVNLKFAFVKIYQRDFAKLWFKPNLSNLWPVSSDPKIEDAIDNGTLQSCPARRALLRETGEIGEKPAKQGEEPGFYWVTVFHGSDDGTEPLRGSTSPKSRSDKQDGSGGGAVVEPIDHDEPVNSDPRSSTSSAPVSSEKPVYQKAIDKFSTNTSMAIHEADKVKLNQYRAAGKISEDEYEAALEVWMDVANGLEQANEPEEDDF